MWVEMMQKVDALLDYLTGKVHFGSAALAPIYAVEQQARCGKSKSSAVLSRSVRCFLSIHAMHVVFVGDHHILTCSSDRREMGGRSSSDRLDVSPSG
jgi:hypothetical protein